MSKYNGQHSAQRIRIIVFLTLLTALLLGSFWLLQFMHNGSTDADKSRPRNKPDYFIEQFKYVKMSETGVPRYDISGARMTHLPDSDSFEITLPVITSLDTNKAPMTLRSERGMINDDQTKIHLYDKVVANRAAFGKSERILVTSDYLLFLPDDDVIKTDLPVNITMGTATMKSVGMIANNTMQEVQLLRSVRGTYQKNPPPPQ